MFRMTVMNNVLVFCFTACVVILTAGCGGGAEQKERKLKESDLKEPFIEANRRVVKTETQHINDFLKRYRWPVKETGSGLKYYIYHHGKGKKAQPDDVAEVNRSVKLITGDLVYSSEKSGPLVFTIGKGQVVRGLEEGILLLRVGDKAKFIIPSHLGYRLLGDQDKIPPKATLIYDVELINLK